MKGNQFSAQEDLFGTTRIQNLQQQVKELGASIDRALKKNNYEKARELTARQEVLINELVALNAGE